MGNGPTVGVFTRSTGRVSQGAARFAKQIEEFGIRSKRDITKVFRVATGRLVQEMQKTSAEGGNLPFKDGYLRASLVITINGSPPKADRTKKDSTTSYDFSKLETAINKAKIGDRVIASYTMRYARRLEYGFTGTDSLGRKYNQPPRAFARMASQKWKGIVEEVAREVKAAKDGAGASQSGTLALAAE